MRFQSTFVWGIRPSGMWRVTGVVYLNITKQCSALRTLGYTNPAKLRQISADTNPQNYRRMTWSEAAWILLGKIHSRLYTHSSKIKS